MSRDPVIVSRYQHCAASLAYKVTVTLDLLHLHKLSDSKVSRFAIVIAAAVPPSAPQLLRSFLPFRGDWAAGKA